MLLINIENCKQCACMYSCTLATNWHTLMLVCIIIGVIGSTLCSTALSLYTLCIMIIVAYKIKLLVPWCFKILFYRYLMLFDHNQSSNNYVVTKIMSTCIEPALAPVAWVTWNHCTTKWCLHSCIYTWPHIKKQIFVSINLYGRSCGGTLLVKVNLCFYMCALWMKT